MHRLNRTSPHDSDLIDMDVSLKVPIRTRSSPVHRNPRNSRSSVLIFATVSIVVIVVCVMFLIFRDYRGSVEFRYGMVIDGGSTGSRIHVFRYGLGENGISVFDFEKDALGSTKVNPGLSAYWEDPEAAGESLLNLLEFGKSKVPKIHWKETEVRLMATAGLRMLELEVQERILASCRMVLKSSDFMFRDSWASVITGSDEGIYAWVAANYALGTLGGHPHKTTGIIELGGASAQVTFVSSEALPPEYSRTLRFGNSTYNLYSRSFLNFGQIVAFDSLRESLASGEFKLSDESFQRITSIDPCTPKGYSGFTLHARGNFSECRSVARMLLQKERCTNHGCHSDSTLTPKLHGKFLATENFFYTSKFFGLPPRASLTNLMMVGQRFCQEDWSKLKKKHYSIKEEDLQRYCFSSAYIVALLHDNLGIALDDKRVEFSNQVGNIPLDWAFGAFILQSIRNVKNRSLIRTIISEDSPTLLSLGLICAVLTFTAWSIFKWKKPQLKTIYDLDKGRYIVTRMVKC